MCTRNTDVPKVSLCPAGAQKGWKVDVVGDLVGRSNTKN